MQVCLSIALAFERGGMIKLKLSLLNAAGVAEMTSLTVTLDLSILNYIHSVDVEY